MSTPDYDLDDILNEIINKNVGENIVAKMDEIDKAKEEENKEEPKAETQPEKTEEEPKALEEVKVFEPKKEEKKVEEPKAVETEEVKPEEVQPKEVKTEKEPEPQAPEEPPVTSTATVVYKDEPKPEKPVKTEKNPEPQAPIKDEIDEPFLESNTKMPEYDEDGNVNFLELGGFEKEEAPRRVKSDLKKNGKRKWRKTKAGKICISIILVLVLAIGGSVGYLGWYLNDVLNTVVDNDNKTTTTNEWKGMETDEENFDPITENAFPTSYRDMVKQWYYNGEPASKTSVLNVMLIGEDTRGDEISDSGTRADSAIIASVNTQTGEIILTSILRDASVYYETTPGDESTGKFGKINGAMAFGGVDCYINAVERMFKVNIDNYVIVNFTSFKNIIDSLGGVTITMSAAEIREINNHPNTYGKVTITGEPGELLLNGEQALAYCRIRHIDSDNARADRQKTVLLQLFKKAKDASAMKLAELATTLMPYVKTGFAKKEILSIGQYALSHGWIGYKTVTYTVPTNETNTDGTALTTCKGGTYYGEWVWKVDCPLASQILQKKIYGKTSITLAENRPSFTALSDY